MSSRIVLIVLFLNSFLAFAQEKTIKHTIVKGETISSIAEKYDVKQSAIFKLNPSAKKLLKLNSVLIIPTHEPQVLPQKNKKTTTIVTKEHEVQAKQSFYAIAKLYGITVNDLKEVNPLLASTELQIGQKINVPASVKAIESSAIATAKSDFVTKEETTKTEAIPAGESFEWEVLPKETKYSIAKKYGITIKEFDKANPTLGVKALKAGQKVMIPVSLNSNVALAAAVPSKLNSLATDKQIENKQPIETVTKQETKTSEAITIVREVLPKETKYAIAKQYGISVRELENQNPAIKNGLPVGFKLNITSSTIPEGNAVAAAPISINDAAIENSKIDFNATTKPNFNHDFLDQLIQSASENIGVRYRSGGSSKAGFDCSGLMCNTFGAFDIKLPRTSREQSTVGVQVSVEEAQKGDLIFFKTNGRSQINHVGMVVEVTDGEIKFIHSSTSNGVIISSTKEKYYEKNFSQINRVIQ